MIKEVPDMAELINYAKSCRNRPGSAYYEEVSAGLQQAVTKVLTGEGELDAVFDELQETEAEIYSR